jgi:signal transduction histidine kinase
VNGRRRSSPPGVRIESACLAWPARLHAAGKAVLAREVASVVRHDLVNLLSAIGNAAFLSRQALAGDDGSAKAEVDSHLRAILGHVEEASETLGRSSVRGSASAAWVDPSALATGLLASLTPPQGVRLRGPEPVHWRVLCDPLELELAMFLLVENAVEATASRGGGDVLVWCERRGRFATLDVVEGGPCPSPKVLEHAFDPWFTTKPGRIGFGLALVRSIAQRWAGSAEIADARPGVRATLLLPVNA